MLFETIVIFITCLSIGEAEEFKIVTINQGQVRGYKALNSEVFEFYGIPYATAPTGNDKFKAPLPAPTWTETLEAVTYNIGCPQNPLFFPILNVTEDCLVANVLVPNTETENLSVVVYIHGGAYMIGYGLLLSPKPLVESQKIIAVTFNYRLGVHGFLCLGTEDIPGNAGLQDMLAALRWVKENVASFGGNPDDITLAGFSAGASAADLLSLSEVAKGLFNKLILDSGAHVSAWSVQIDPIKTAQDYAQKLNFRNVGSLNALEEFYKTASYELLFSDMSGFETYNSDFGFVPCIEKDVGQERILDDSPENIIKSSEYTMLPTLSGFANMEGIIRLPQFDDWAPKMNAKFSDFLVCNLNFENDDEKDELAKTIKEFYFGSSTVGLYSLFNYIDYFTDVIFAYSILRSVKLQVDAGHDQIFLYEYSFYNKYVSVPGVPDVLTNFPGATHTEQTLAVLQPIFSKTGTVNSVEQNYTEEYLKLRANMREIWVNFITTGTPVSPASPYPSWPPANASRAPHMIFGDTIELGEALNEQRAQFWDEIYDRYYRQPIPPVFVESNSASLNSGFIVQYLVFINFILFYMNTN